MTEPAVTLFQSLLIWLATTVVASLVSASAYPLYRALNRRSMPESAAFGQLVYALLPPLAATLITVMVMTPSLSGMVVPAHCHTGDCSGHRPMSGNPSPLFLALVALASLVLFLAAILLSRTLWRTRRRLLALYHLSSAETGSSYRVVNTPAPLAWCAGIFRPRIYLSRGLLSRLDERQIDVVLAHERNHAARRDNLRATLVHWATLLWPGRRRKRFRADLDQCTEQACNRAAARTVGDPDLVSRVVNRLNHNHGPGAPISPRDRADGIDAGPAGALCRWTFVATLWLIQVLLLSGAAHSAVEWIM